MRDGRSGGVAILQRFGAALNLNVHAHALILVYVEEPAGGLAFHALAAPTEDEMERVLAVIAVRLRRLLARRGRGAQEPDGEGEAAAEFGQTSNVDQIFTVTGATTTSAGPAFYDHVDALGSVRFVTDGEGQTIRQCDYLPFGTEWQCTGVSDPRAFAGMEASPETGGGMGSPLNNAGARYYSQQVGRFISPDPNVDIKTSVADPQRWNRYSYVRNNPLRFVDPGGRCFENACIAETAVTLTLLQRFGLQLFNWPTELTNSPAAFHLTEFIEGFALPKIGGSPIAAETGEKLLGALRHQTLRNDSKAKSRRL